MFAGDAPELWSDAELKRELTKHLGRGPHSMKAIRRFHEMMDELVERRQAAGARGTPSEIWARCVEELSK